MRSNAPLIPVTIGVAPRGPACNRRRHGTVLYRMNSKQHRFEVLAGALADDLYRFAYWLCGDPHLAQDLVQETLLRAWRSLDRLRDARAAKGWLLTTLRREHARLYERKRPALVDVDDVEVADGFDPGPDALADTELVRRCIFELPVQYREPLALQMLLGCSVAEIADVLELSQTAVMSRLFRARRQIMDRLLPGRGRGGAEVRP